MAAAAIISESRWGCWPCGAAACGWAGGAALESVLREADMPAGDFVRWTKQLIDLLGQVGQAAGDRDAELRRTADAAVDALRRGVVAYSSVG